jgi:hydrogenase nickel incorporation protein HypA/HybF
MSDLIDVVRARRDPRRVLVVRLVVGARSGVAIDALRFSFDVCAEGTELEAATLEIVETAGDELRLEEIEVSACA